jgi:sugar/nucleoside kinase (ribokinase family)
MDLFALGTPVIDLFARADKALLAKLRAREGATNFFSAKELASIEHKLGRRITHRYPGDNARNVCEGFAALGGSCCFQGAVANDAAGSEFASNLRVCGVAAFLQHKEGSTGKIISLVSPGGQRTFCADLGVGTACGRFEGGAFRNSHALFLTTITLGVPSPAARLAMRYLEAAKKGGKRVAISLESPPMVEKNRAKFMAILEKYADVVFLNEDEAAALLGPLYAKKLLRLKPEIPIYLKKGGRGSVLFLKQKASKIDAVPAKVVDTTGAGDAYAAGALYGLSRGYSPLSSGRLGSMLAAKVVAKIGTGIPLAHTRMRIRHGKMKD